MDLRFWGVRGGIPTPEAGKMRFGGNTSCVSVQLADGTLIILDAGTGIRLLGNELVRRFPQGGIRGHILLSHLHWDHIQGIPFFKPLFSPNNLFEFIGLRQEGTTLRAQLEGQQNYAYFPVDMGHMSSRKDFREVCDESFRLGEATVRCRRLNHPGGCLGYRIEAGGVSVVYATDNEHTGPGPEEAVVELARGADLLIFDTNYTPEEYEAGRRGWGHSTWLQAVVNAQAAGVDRLVLYHHDQDHNDQQLEEIEALACELFPRSLAAREGMRIRLAGPSAGDGPRVLIDIPEPACRESDTYRGARLDD
jgi:phosphoribosyl 1,2-cyclic phosphodiesterase